MNRLIHSESSPHMRPYEDPPQLNYLDASYSFSSDYETGNENLDEANMHKEFTMHAQDPTPIMDTSRSVPIFGYMVMRSPGVRFG